MLSYLLILHLFAYFKELRSSPNSQSTMASVLLPCLGHCPPPDPKLNHRPIIGILSHPGDGASGRFNNATNASYIAASYVKFVESGGARVIPLLYNEPPVILYKKLNLVNGVLLPGGSTKKGPYFEVVESIFKNVVRKNDAGDHFPLLAICLGFELLAMIVGKFHKCSLFFLEVYVSTVQARRYPVTAFQWHPEKNAFEWGLPRIPHSEAAVQVTQNVANFFVREARKSMNRPSSWEVLENLIYKYRPTYCGKAGKGFDQVYIFS
ncbi:hypothetical protein Pfo_014277 [Paulownia fortunei]|nr:hypothetical protein Pfo_014277 [Paulownia fortunei]